VEALTFKQGILKVVLHARGFYIIEIIIINNTYRTSRLSASVINPTFELMLFYNKCNIKDLYHYFERKFQFPCSLNMKRDCFLKVFFIGSPLNFSFRDLFIFGWIRLG